MRNYSTWISVIFIVVTLSLSSCSKYDDGPGLSLRSKTERVSNSWKVEQYLENGKDETSQMNDFIQTFDKDGTYSFSFSSSNESGDGKWAFQNDEEQVKISGIDNQPSATLYVLKLKEKELWYYLMDGNDKYEFHLVPSED